MMVTDRDPHTPADRPSCWVMVWGMRTRHIIARWLGYHTRLATRVETLEGELRDHEAQVQALLARCRANRAAIMEAEDRMGRAHTLVARARHTMNINPKGAQAMLDQAVGLLEDDR